MDAARFAAGFQAARTMATCMVFLAAGCGRENVVPVSGRVTLNGQPLAGALVTFQPIHERGTTNAQATGSVGLTDAQGRFNMRLVEPDWEGACVGTHVVTISTAMAASSDDEAPLKGEMTPWKWRDGSQRFTVPPAGTASADFELRGDWSPRLKSSKTK